MKLNHIKLLLPFIIIFFLSAIVFQVAPLLYLSESYKTVLEIQIQPPLYTVPNALQSLTTAYSELDSCHYPNCIMASGKRAYIGSIACPRDLKLGTKVIIDHIKYTCEDRYNKNLSYRFDIFMGYGEESHQKAVQYGKKESLIIIIE